MELEFNDEERKNVHDELHDLLEETDLPTPAKNDSNVPETTTTKKKRKRNKKKKAQDGEQRKFDLEDDGQFDLL